MGRNHTSAGHLPSCSRGYEPVTLRLTAFVPHTVALHGHWTRLEWETVRRGRRSCGLCGLARCCCGGVRWARLAESPGRLQTTQQAAMGASDLRVRAGVVDAVSRDRSRGVAHLCDCLSRDEAASPHPARANGAWPAAFFGIRDKRASLVIIASLDLSLGFEVARLRVEDRRAAGLLVPCLAWCGFATALNAAVSEPEAHHSQ